MTKLYDGTNLRCGCNVLLAIFPVICQGDGQAVNYRSFSADCSGTVRRDEQYVIVSHADHLTKCCLACAKAFFGSEPPGLSRRG